MVRSPPGTPTIIAKSSLLSCWYVKHPIINYTPPIPLGLVRVVMLCWLMTDFHDRLNEREELSPTDSAENRAFHDSIHRYRKLDWTNERTKDFERLFLANWPTGTDSRKINIESITGNMIENPPIFGWPGDHWVVEQTYCTRHISFLDPWPIRSHKLAYVLFDMNELYQIKYCYSLTWWWPTQYYSQWNRFC